ncbi:hypothetical protein PG993_003269 [Apiospora rasikravindrae]|uniref:Uncharacterized protein n=1 Tax=Apiospora rasikravindrae TaxID=990691 RepID=A0ABR1TZ29_9PEZI
MGLFSFLSRKASQDQRDLALLKAQPYNATVAALPPIRGAYPVAGNGPNILESLQKTQRPFVKAGEPFVDSFSPAPIVPRFRGEDCERPRTAPSQESRGRLDSFKGFSGSFRNEASAGTLESSAKGPPYRLPSKSPEEGVPKPPYGLPSTQHVFSKPPPVFHERSASIRSGDSGMTRGFVDLLDAQSTISPINFHQRLQAAGGKIYGEDVADRNIRENGFNLDLPAIRAFYEQPSREAPLPPSGNTSRSDASADLKSRARKRHSIGATLRTKSSTLSDKGSFPERTSSVVPSIPPEYRTSKAKKNEESTATKASRRKSMPGYIVSSSPADRSRSSSTMSKQHTKNQDANSFPTELQERGKNLASVPIADDKSIKSYGSNRRSVLVKSHGDSFVLSEPNNDEADYGVARRISVLYPLVVDSSRPKSMHRDTASHTIISVSGQSPSKRTSIHSMQSPLQLNPPDVSHSGSRSPILEPGRSKHDLGSISDLHDTTSHASAQLQQPRSPCLGSSHIYQNSNDGSSVHAKGRACSLASTSGRGARRLDIEGSIPERTSSIRQWSMDSTTATLSSLSSNPFRPHSRHTANTSVDLMPYVKGVNSSRETFGSAAYHTASENYSQPSVSAISPLSPQSGFNVRTEPCTNFNIDDELSSDDDDFSPRHPRGSGEEDLIFNPSGYGFDAGELPGLPNPLDFATSLEKPHPVIKLRSSKYSLRGHQAFGATVPDYDSDFLSLPTSPTAASWANSRGQNSRFQSPKYEYTDLSDDNGHAYGTDDEDTEDELSFDIPFSRGNTPNRQPPRATRWAGSQSDVIEEEENTQKRVLETAAKLRREAKRLNRMSGATVRRRKESFSNRGKEAARSVHPGVSNGSDADIE